MFKTIEDVKKKCTTYFHKDRVEIFGIRVESEVLYGEYFISSCKLHPWFNMKPRLRRYYIAKALDIGRVIGIGEGYTTKRKALIALHSIKEVSLQEKDMEEKSCSYCKWWREGHCFRVPEKIEKRNNEFCSLWEALYSETEKG